jgi:hypothetical protein
VLSVGDPAFVATHWRYVGGLLLAADEALATPRKVTVHGGPTDERTLTLREVALQERAQHEPDLAVVGATPLDAAAAPFAIVCAPSGLCSDPATTRDALLGALFRGPPR